MSGAEPRNNRGQKKNWKGFQSGGAMNSRSRRWAEAVKCRTITLHSVRCVGHASVCVIKFYYAGHVSVCLIKFYYAGHVSVCLIKFYYAGHVSSYVCVYVSTVGDEIKKRWCDRIPPFLTEISFAYLHAVGM
jgi:hypothetical protein